MIARLRRALAGTLALTLVIATGGLAVPQYPELPLRVRCRIAPGADLSANPSGYTWKDVSVDLSRRGAIRLKVGADDEQGETNSELALTLRDPAGRYTSDNPMSDLWPGFDLGCPIEVSVDPQDGAGFRQLCVQYVAELDDWWSDAGNARLQFVDVIAAGLLRRLGQGDAIHAALPGTILSRSHVAPLAYYPLNDGDTATQASSGLPGGGPPLLVTRDTVAFGSIDGPPGLPDQTIDLSGGGTLIGVLPANTTTGDLIIETAFQLSSTIANTSARIVLAKLYMTGGTIDSIELSAGDIGGGEGLVDVTMISVPSGGVVTNGGTSASTAAVLEDDRWHFLRAVLHQSGADITSDLYIDGLEVGPGPSMTTQTLGHPVKVAISPTTFIGASQVGYTSLAALTIYNNASAPDLRPASTGYLGEHAADRLLRLCAEVGVPASATVGAGEAMGAQPVDKTLPELLREDVVGTDHGILDDSRGVINYTSLGELLNPPVAFSIDARNRELYKPFAPTRDDQKHRNRITATGAGGSSIQEDAADIIKVGIYPDQLDVNVADVGQLPHHAGFRLRQGLVPGNRFPFVTLDLLRSPQLVASWLAARLGARIPLLNPPSRYSRETVEVMLHGYEMEITGVRMPWRVQMNTSRAAPWLTGTLDDTALGHLDTAGMVLAADWDGSAGTFTTTTTSGPLASVAGADYPIDLNIDGQRVTVSVFAGATDPQTATVSVASVNGVRKLHLAGADVRLWQPMRWAM